MKKELQNNIEEISKKIKNSTINQRPAAKISAVKNSNSSKDLERELNGIQESRAIQRPFSVSSEDKDDSVHLQVPYFTKQTQPTKLDNKES